MAIATADVIFNILDLTHTQLLKSSISEAVTGGAIKKRLQQRFFPVKFTKLLGTPILKKICVRLLAVFLS